MKQINYKSDFDFIFRLYDSNGNDLGVPTFDWELMLWTGNNKANKYRVAAEGKKNINWFNDAGRIHVVCNAHNLGRGELHCEFIAHLPNNIYPDGEQRTFTPMPLDIELVEGAGEYTSQTTVGVLGGSAKSNRGGYTAEFVSRGYIRTGSKPGFVYRYAPADYAFEPSRPNPGGVLVSGIKLNRPFPQYISIAKAFPGGKFEGEDIVVDLSMDIKGEYNRDAGIIRIDSIDDFARLHFAGLRIQLPNMYSGTAVKDHFLTVDSTGKIIRANMPRTASYRREVDLSFNNRWKIDADTIRKVIESYNQLELEYPDFKNAPKIELCVELGYNTVSAVPNLDGYRNRRSMLIEVQHSNRKGRMKANGDSYYYHKWMGMHKLPRMGVIRARIHTRSGKVSPWRYFRFWTDDPECLVREIKRRE